MSAEIILTPSKPAWLDAVLADFDRFLSDHASAEKKAAGMALNVASHYPDRPQLLKAMAELAAEEMNHYREVVTLMVARGITPAPDVKDAYVNGMQAELRRGSAYFLLDRLLVAALIEARGQERFALVAAALPPGPLKQFYRAIARSEARHGSLFLSLARSECLPEFTEAEIARRLHTLQDVETAIIESLPARAALH